MNMTDKELAENLQRLRLERGLSQSKLSMSSGVNLRTIQQLEAGVNRILGAKIETLLPIAKVLGVTLEELIGE